MKTKRRIKPFLLLVFCVCCLTYKGQVLKTKLIRLADKSYMGYTDTVDNVPILVNANGNIVVSGNQKINASQYDATTMEQLSGGIQNWINQVSASGEKSFITASCHDAAGNIYNAGAYRSTTSNGLDFFVQKVTASGSTAWTKYYDNGMNDGAIAICTDLSGNVYVTGPSEGLGLIDYATVAFDSWGSQKWSSRYDYGNLIDVPTAIFYEPTGNRIYVTGSSANSYTDWDFANVRYNAASGLQTDVERIPGGVGNDKVLGAVTDSDGNIYTVGTAFNGLNYDVQVVKLDTAFNQVFVKTFDGNGLDDAAVAVSLDSNGNIIVIGTSYVTPGVTEILLLKYDKNGNKVWDKRRPGPGGQSAEGLRLKIKSDNEYLVAGNYGVGVNQDIALLCYDSLGYLSLEARPYDDSGFRDRLMDMTFDGNHIYLTARTMSAANAPTEQNLILHYEIRDLEQSVVTQGTSPFFKRHIDNEVIISFNKAVCKMSTLNNKEQTFGQLNQFIADSTCDKITRALDPEHTKDMNARLFPVRKIFFDMTEGDSLSESRLGNHVKVPAFYTSLVVTLPFWISTTGAIDPLNTLYRDINYAQLNNVYTLASPPNTNDPHFATSQAALHPIAPYLNGHINADSAWAITTGAAHIRVGILDSGIEPGHQDLPTHIGGFDFCANSNLANGDIDNHGTGVAGTVGAIRNNGIGIAGVAGGDAAAGQPGVTLFDMKVTNNGYVTDAWASNGLYKAVAGTNIGGFAQHIATHGYYWAVSYDKKIWGHGVNQLIIDQTNFANRNGVAVLYPKANFPNVGTNVFPADWADETIMSVGSNGFNGEHCSPAQQNCSNGSTTWGEIDFIAPGTVELVKTTSRNGDYILEDGTSFATPHVAGTAALMMSYRNTLNASWNNLVHEDIEHLIQRTCTDLVNSAYGEKAGYDTVSGWGRINAYKAVKGLNKNFYGIKHITETIGNSGVSAPVLSQVFTDTMTWTNYPGVPTGTHITEIWKRTVVINYNLLPSEKIIDKWPLYKECYGTKFDSTYVDADRPFYGRIDSLTTSSCTMSTFYYKIPGLNRYMPYEPAQLRSAFTVYTYDSLGIVGIDKHTERLNYTNFNVFPNPHQSSFEVEFGSDYTDNLSYRLSNVMGQVVQTGNYRAGLGFNRMKISSNTLMNGVYILTIFNGNKELYKQKIIKQE